MTRGPPVDVLRPPPLRWVGVALLIGGVACDFAAVVGIIEVGLFRLRSPGRANAVVVDHVSDDSSGLSFHDILEFPAPGKTVRITTRGPFGIPWGWRVDREGLILPGHELGEKIPVRYSPHYPEYARPNLFEYQLAAPLLVLLVGAVLTPLGILVFYRGLILARSSSRARESAKRTSDQLEEEEAMARIPAAIVSAAIVVGCGSSQSSAPKPLTKLELETDMAARLALSEVQLNDEGGGRFTGKGKNGDGVEVQLDVKQEARQLSWKSKWNGKTKSGGHSEGETAGSASR